MADDIAIKDIDSYAKDLRKRIWITKGSRFISSRTLSRKNELSITSISFVSIYGIAITIIQVIFASGQCKSLNDFYTVTSLLLSIFILVLSLLEGSKNYQVKAERLYKNATSFAKLSKKLEYDIASHLEYKEFKEELESIRLEYEKLINNCPENHNPDDYFLFKVENRNEFNIDITITKECWITAKCFIIFIMNYWLYYFFIIGVPIIFIFLFSTFRCS